MKALKFELEGITAFFKNSDINNSDGDMWFSFPHIHKVALFGILGALLGYDGYRQQGKMVYPEFFEKMMDKKISIVPDKPIFKRRKVETTNTAGYSNENKKNGSSTMISKEYWLEGTPASPLKWTIYILDDESDVFKEILSAILNNNMCFHPYLGNNHHFIDIKNQEIVKLVETDSKKVNSIFLLNDDLKITAPFGMKKNIYTQFFAPISLNKKTNKYIFKQHVITNRNVDGLKILSDGKFNISLI